MADGKRNNFMPRKVSSKTKTPAAHLSVCVPGVDSVKRKQHQRRKTVEK